MTQTVAHLSHTTAHLSPVQVPPMLVYMYKYVDQKGSAAMLAIKKSACATPEMNLRNPLHAYNKAYKWEIRPDLGDLGQMPREFQNRVISGPTKIILKYQDSISFILINSVIPSDATILCSNSSSKPSVCQDKDIHGLKCSHKLLVTRLATSWLHNVKNPPKLCTQEKTEETVCVGNASKRKSTSDKNRKTARLKSGSKLIPKEAQS